MDFSPWFGPKTRRFLQFAEVGQMQEMTDDIPTTQLS